MKNNVHDQLRRGRLRLAAAIGLILMLLATSLASLVALAPPADAQVITTVVNGDGGVLADGSDGLRIHVSSNLQMQVRYRNVNSMYNPGATDASSSLFNGIYLAIEDELASTAPHGSPVDPYVTFDFLELSQTPVLGAGTIVDPYLITTSVYLEINEVPGYDPGEDIRLDHTVSYVDNRASFKQTYTVTTPGGIPLKLYHVIDSHLAGTDTGPAYALDEAGAETTNPADDLQLIGVRKNVGQPNEVFMAFVEEGAHEFSHAYSGTYDGSGLYAGGLANGGDIVDTLMTAASTDNGFGVQYDLNPELTGEVSFTNYLAYDFDTVPPYAELAIDKYTESGPDDAGDGIQVPFGDGVVWFAEITNTGDVTVSDIAVEDNPEGAYDCGTVTSLAPGESMTCTITGTALLGDYSNRATVTGGSELGDVEASDGSSYVGIGEGIAPIEIEKYTNDVGGHFGDIAAGEPVEWTFKVINNTNYPFEGFEVVDDPQGAAICEEEVVPPGGFIWCSIGPVPAIDGLYSNTVEVTGGLPEFGAVSATDDGSYNGVGTYECAEGQEHIELFAGPVDDPNPRSGLPPWTRDFGDVDSDSVFAHTEYIPAGKTVVSGHFETRLFARTLGSNDMLHLGNWLTPADRWSSEVWAAGFTVDAWSTRSFDLSSELGLDLANMSANGFIDVVLQDDTDIEYLQFDLCVVPTEVVDLTVSKVTSSGGVADDGLTLAFGEALTWVVEVVNTGDVPVTGITVVDDTEPGAYDCDGVTSLAPGESMFCTILGTVLLGGYENVATVTGSSSLGEITRSDGSSYVGISESVGPVEVEKYTNDVRGHFGDIAVGDEVGWYFKVINNTTEPLVDFEVVDSVEGQATCEPSVVAPGGFSLCFVEPSVAIEGLYENRVTVNGALEGFGGVTATDDGSYNGVAEFACAEGEEYVQFVRQDPDVPTPRAGMPASSRTFTTVGFDAWFSHSETLPSNVTVTSAQFEAALFARTLGSNDWLHLGDRVTGTAGAGRFSSKVNQLPGVSPDVWSTTTVTLPQDVLDFMSTSGVVDVFLQDDTDISYLKFDLCVVPGPGCDSNDDLACADLIPSSPLPQTVSGSNVGATKEVAEVGGSCYNGTTIESVWWEWTADASGPVVAHTFGSDYDTMLTLFTGSSYPLSEVGCNDDAAAVGPSSITFNALAGETYRFQVWGWNGDAGNIDLTLAVPGMCDGRPATHDMNLFGITTITTASTNDVILGTPANDTITSQGGNDVICGGSGDDVIRSGSGNDRVFGGPGADDIGAGGGDDWVSGQSGNDDINGQSGNDRLSGSSGNDVISGGPGDDVLLGSTGDDVIHGDAGIDRILGSDGIDELFGGDDVDRIRGGNGDDIIEGDGGDDRLYGENGNDTMHGGLGNDFMSGRDGNDVLSGGDGNDTIKAGNDDDELFGGDGNDVLDGGNGNDELSGDAGIDKLLGKDGDDTLFGGADNDRLYGQLGDDILHGEGGDDELYASHGDDFSFGGAGNDYLNGSKGIDELDGEAGTDECTANAADPDVFISCELP